MIICNLSNFFDGGGEGLICSKAITSGLATPDRFCRGVMFTTFVVGYDGLLIGKGEGKFVAI